ncbi:TPA: type 1 fimbrial protein [Citrobacter freundii]|nr:type 1 fimbrial protein [Citrobacter freundii]
MMAFSLISLLFPCSGFSATGNTDTATITITGRVRDATCSFDKSDYPLTLADVSPSDFTGVGVINQTKLVVDLSCGPDASGVKIKVSGSPDPTQNSVFANKGDATGVGIQVRDQKGNIMLPAGSSTADTLVVDNSTYKATYSFYIGYEKVGSSVTGGSVSTVLNLVFDYM